jgi:hypothetical protein
MKRIAIAVQNEELHVEEEGANEFPIRVAETLIIN